jgi:hypothetical protein
MQTEKVLLYASLWIVVKEKNIFPMASSPEIAT